MSVVIAVGGTGGHLFPALALAEALSSDGVPVRLVGGRLAHHAIPFSFAEVACAPVSLKVRDLLMIVRGVAASLKELRSFRPDLVVGFGSYATFPPLVATRLLRIPYLLHEQNAMPGRVNRLFASAAQVTALHLPVVEGVLKGKSVPVAMPLRWRPKKGLKEEALAYFGLSSGKKTVLVFGGSQGAASLNRLLPAAFKGRRGLQLLHFTGSKEEAVLAEARWQEIGLLACVKAFEERMDLAWSAADLAVTRAGGATIAELIAFGVPTLLIPYPFAKDQHQEANARFVADEVGGAVLCMESDLSGGKGKGALDELFNEERALSMRRALEEQRQKGRSLPTLAQIVMELL